MFPNGKTKIRKHLREYMLTWRLLENLSRNAFMTGY